MRDVDLYLKVRHAVRIEGLSERAAARRFGIDPRTVNEMVKFSVPPGYVRKKPPAKPKLDPSIPGSTAFSVTTIAAEEAWAQALGRLRRNSSLSARMRSVLSFMVSLDQEIGVGGSSGRRERPEL